VRQILAASKKLEERAALLRDVVADCAAQHRIPGFQSVQYGTLRDCSGNFQLHFIPDMRQIAQVRGQASPGIMTTFAPRRKAPPEDRAQSAPVISCVGGAVHLPSRSAKIHATLVQRIHGHRVAQDVDVAVLLRQAFRERFPFVAAFAAAVDAQFSIRR